MKRNDPIGDLAREVKRDREFPIAEASHARLQAYLERTGAIPDAIRAFQDAWREFEATGTSTQDDDQASNLGR